MVVLRVHIDIGLAVGGVAGIVVLLTSPTRDFGLLLTLAALTCLSVAPLVALALAAWGDRRRVVVRHHPPRKARENPSENIAEKGLRVRKETIVPAIRVDRVGTEVPRAKPLPRSGLFRAVHAPESAAANSVTQVSESARAQSRSVRRSAAAAQLARLLNNALDADIIPQAALAAAIDRHASEVSEMCRRAEEPRAKDMTGADVLLSAVASQSFYEGFRETVEIMRRSNDK